MTNSAANSASTVQVLYEEEVPDPPTATVTTIPSPSMPMMTQAPSPPPQRHPPSLLPAFQALALILAARLQGLLLVLSAIAFGGMAVHDPDPLRLVGAAGYGLFCLAALWVLPQK